MLNMMTTRFALAVKRLALAVTVVGIVGATRAATIDLTPPDAGTLVVTYTHDYARSIPTNNGFPDPNVTLTNMTAVVNYGSHASFYQVSSGAQGTLRFDFEFDPASVNPYAYLISVEVVSHTHDWDSGNLIGQWDTDLTGVYTTFYDSNTDGGGILTDTLSGTGIENAQSLSLLYTANVGTSGSIYQQVFGIHDSATTAWTFTVTAYYGIPEPASAALLGLAGLVLLKRTRKP